MANSPTSHVKLHLRTRFRFDHFITRHLRTKLTHWTWIWRILWTNIYLGDDITDALQRCFVSRNLIGSAHPCSDHNDCAWALETCLNPPRGRGEKRIGTLASEDDLEAVGCLLSCPLFPFMKVLGSLICMVKFHWAAKSVAHVQPITKNINKSTSIQWDFNPQPESFQFLRSTMLSENKLIYNFFMEKNWENQAKHIDW